MGHVPLSTHGSTPIPETEFFGLGLMSFGLGVKLCGLVNNVARPADSCVIIGIIRQTVRQLNL